MQKLRISLLFVFLLIIALIAGANLVDYATDTSVGLNEKLLVFSTAAIIIALLVGTFGVRFKRQERQLQFAREQNAGAYHCTPEMSGKLFIIATSDTDLVLYYPKKNLPEYARIPLSSVTLSRADVRVNAVKSVTGIEVKARETGEVALRLVLCKDVISPVNMPPLQEPELTKALTTLGVSA